MIDRLAPASRRSLVALAIAAVAIAGLLILRNLTVDGPLDRLRHSEHDGRQLYQGSWLFPRGGPYMLGFDSPGGRAGLFIDGKPWVCGAGHQLRHEGDRLRMDARRLDAECRDLAPPELAPRPDARGDFMPGVVAVRFEAPPGARLLWIPPGRRSDPEYVPASSLSPEPPERAHFGSWAGAAPADAVIATLIALVGLALVLYLLRTPLRRIDRRLAVWALAVFALALALRLYHLGGAGETWDENTQWSAGRNYVDNLLSLDFHQASWRWNYQHPPVSKLVYGVGALWADGYGPARGLAALMVAIACALMVPIGRRIYSLPVGIGAGAIAALTPHLIAHGQIVGHEAVAVLLWTLAVWGSLACFDPDPTGQPVSARRLAGRMALLGLVLGLAFWSRFSNALLGPLIAAILLLQAPRGLRRRTLILAATVLPLVAVAVGFLIWPRLWSEPIVHLQESWAKLKVPHTPEPFLGAITNTPPRSYFAVYLVATAPLGILIGGLLWLVRSLRFRDWRPTLVVLLWLAVPLLILFSPVRQDGVRYVLPSLMALALIAAAGLDFLVWAIERRWSPVRRPATLALAGAMVLYLGVIDHRVQPYYLDYYGELYGGPARVAADKSFEIAWWGEGLAGAVDYLNRHAEPDARVYKRCISPYDHLGWLRGDLWSRLAPRPAAADWILVYQPALRACPIPDDFALVHQESCAGAPLARVYHRVAAEAPPSR